MGAGARAAAEREMRKRDLAEARGRTQGRGRDVLDRFRDEDEEDDEDGEDGADLQSRRTRRRAERAQQMADQEMGQMGDDEQFIENLEDRKGYSLREWVLLDLPNREIERRFRNFLNTFVDEHGENVHATKIKAMCEANAESLVVSYTHLCTEHPVLAIFVADAPTEVLAIFDRAAKQVVQQSFPAYEQIRPEIHVRIAGLPVLDHIRDIRQVHLNALIKVSGVVNKRTQIFPQMKLAKFSCDKCGASIGPFVRRRTSRRQRRSLATAPTTSSSSPPPPRT